MLSQMGNPESLAFIENIGMSEMAVILVAMLVLFGGKKLPELARGLGKGIRHFKEELNGIQGHITREVDDISARVNDITPARREEPKALPEPPAAAGQESHAQPQNAASPAKQDSLP